MSGDQDRYESLAQMLPFYVNDTLSPEDRIRVEAGLAEDPALRAELEEVRAIGELVRAGGPGLASAAGASPEDRLAALWVRIDADEAPGAPAGEESASAAVLPFRPLRARAAPAFWKPALAAAAVLVAVQAGVIAYQAAAPAHGGYTTLSGASAPRPQGGKRLLVRLSPEARWGEVTALLAAHDLTIVDGPRGGALQLAPASDAQIDTDLKVLRASPLVAFAGPAS